MATDFMAKIGGKNRKQKREKKVNRKSVKYAMKYDDFFAIIDARAQNFMKDGVKKSGAAVAE